MTVEEFVEGVRVAVHEAAVSGTESSLQDPPGRRPSPKDVELSRWYRGLSVEDCARVNSVIRHSVHSAVFGFLCVLDGVRAIEAESKGRLELVYVKDNDRRVLNSESELLHDVYQSLVYEEVFGGSEA
jgi:hypothetical protein